MGRSRVSLRAVAQKAGVSVTTASRVLNNSPIPTAQTRSRVLEAAKVLNYQPDPVLSRAIRDRRHGATPTRTRTGMIGLLMESPGARALCQEATHYTLAMTGMQQALRGTDRHLVLLTPEQTGHIPQSIQDSGLDGLIVWHARLDEALGRYLCRQAPTVLLESSSRPDWPADSVMANAQMAMRSQLEYLWELGHRRIAYFEQAAANGPQQARLAGFNRFFKAKGVPIPCATLNTPRETYPEVHAKVLEAFAQELLEARPRPTSLIASSSYALALLNLLLDKGVKVPEQLSVIGANDDSSGGYLARPALTAYHMPMQEVGRLAVQLLLERIDDPRLPRRHVLVDGHPIERASCAPVNVSVEG